MKKKSLIYSDLSKKQLEKLKEFYIQKKVESMSHQELKEYVLDIIFNLNRYLFLNNPLIIKKK